MRRKKGEGPQMRRMFVSIPEEVYKQLGHQCVETDRTMSEIVAEALKFYFEKGGKRKEKTQ